MTEPARSIGMAWYAREDYPRIRAMMEDAHVLAATYDQWLAAAENNRREAERVGFTVVRASIEPEAFAAWCAERGLAPSGKARTQFANEAAAATDGA